MFIVQVDLTETGATGQSFWETTEPEWSSGQYTTTPLTTTAETTTKDRWHLGDIAGDIGDAITGDIVRGFLIFMVVGGSLVGLLVIWAIIACIYEHYQRKKRVGNDSNPEFIEIEENSTPRNSQTLSDKPPLYDDLSVDIVLPTYDDCNNTIFWLLVLILWPL